MLQIRDTDLDALERVVGIVAYGDLEGEDTHNLTDLNFLRIFRLSQLTAEYLLHVQEQLAQENVQLKVSQAMCAAILLCIVLVIWQHGMSGLPQHLSVTSNWCIPRLNAHVGCSLCTARQLLRLTICIHPEHLRSCNSTKKSQLLRVVQASQGAEH